MQSTQFAIAPLAFLLVIGLSLLFAVTIVLYSLAKSGKGAGAVVVLITLILGGLFLLGLFIPVYQRQQGMAMRMSPPMVSPPRIETEQQMFEMAPHPPETKFLLPLHSEDTPFPTAPPAPPKITVEVPGDAHAEVTTEEEFEQPPAAAPHDASSASPDQPAETMKAPAPSAESASLSSAATPAPQVASKPDWVKSPGVLAQNGVYTVTVEIGPFSSHEEIRHEFMRKVDLEVRHYMEQFIDPMAPSLVKLPPGFIVDRGVLADRWDESHSANEFSFNAPMYTQYVQLRFDENVQRELTERFKQARVVHRVGVFGLGGGLLLALLGTLYGYLKLDTLTQGYYTMRLRFAAALASLGAATAAFAMIAERVVMWV
jgi:hypothetical protein